MIQLNGKSIVWSLNKWKNYFWTQNWFICLAYKQSIRQICIMATWPHCVCYWCIHVNLDTIIWLYIFPFQSTATCFTEVGDRSSRGNRHCSGVACTKLVSKPVGGATSIPTKEKKTTATAVRQISNSPSVEKNDITGMSLVRQKIRCTGFSSQAEDIIMQSWR